MELSTLLNIIIGYASLSVLLPFLVVLIKDADGDIFLSMFMWMTVFIGLIAVGARITLALV